MFTREERIFVTDVREQYITLFLTQNLFFSKEAYN
jgi:hypothetical protein